MRVRILTFLCLIALLAISSPIISAQNQYKVHFNNIVCLNPWNTDLTSNLELLYPINAEFINAAAGKAPNPTPLKYDKSGSEFTRISNRQNAGKVFAENGKTEIRYFNNMSFDKFPHGLLNPDLFRAYAGEANAVSNDRFYMTWRNKPREGFALPIRGGDMDMYRYKFWKPNANDGNPASVVGLDSIIYYLWEADAISKDNPIGQFSINLKEKKGKGPQLVEVVQGDFQHTNLGGAGSWGSSVYVIEYEVK